MYNGNHFGSPELKAQVSFSDHLYSVVCLSFRPSVNFLQFHLLLQNYCDNFNHAVQLRLPIALIMIYDVMTDALIDLKTSNLLEM